MGKDKNYRYTTSTESTLISNWLFNADAKADHAFGIFMVCSGTIRTSCYNAS